MCISVWTARCRETVPRCSVGAVFGRQQLGKWSIPHDVKVWSLRSLHDWMLSVLIGRVWGRKSERWEEEEEKMQEEAVQGFPAPRWLIQCFWDSHPHTSSEPGFTEYRWMRSTYEWYWAENINHGLVRDSSIKANECKWVVLLMSVHYTTKVLSQQMLLLRLLLDFCGLNKSTEKCSVASFSNLSHHIFTSSTAPHLTPV